VYFGFGMEGSSVMQPVAGKLMDVNPNGITGVFNLISYIALGLSAFSIFTGWWMSRRDRNKNGTPPLIN
jgi:hypothetical protein